MKHEVETMLILNYDDEIPELTVEVAQAAFLVVRGLKAL